MESPSVGGTRVLKAVWLTGLCSILVALAIQIEVPTFYEIGESIRLKFAERQLANSPLGQEELLKAGWLYFNLEQYEKAAQYMEKVVAAEENVSAFYCLGLIDMKNRQYESAISRFKMVAAKSPGHEGCRMALGQAYYQLHYWGQAREEFERAVKLEPTDQSARLWLGRTYTNLNQPEKASAILETISHGRESLEAAALLKNIYQQAQAMNGQNGK